MPRWIHDLSLRLKLLGSFGLIIILTLVLSRSAYRGAVSNEKASDQVLHTREVINEISDLRTSLYEIRVGFSGYLLTGGEQALDPYTRGKSEYAASLSRIKAPYL